MLWNIKLNNFNNTTFLKLNLSSLFFTYSPKNDFVSITATQFCKTVALIDLDLDSYAKICSKIFQFIFYTCIGFAITNYVHYFIHYELSNSYRESKKKIVWS